MSLLLFSGCFCSDFLFARDEGVRRNSLNLLLVPRIKAPFLSFFISIQKPLCTLLEYCIYYLLVHVLHNISRKPQESITQFFGDCYICVIHLVVDLLQLDSEFTYDVKGITILAIVVWIFSWYLYKKSKRLSCLVAWVDEYEIWNEKKDSFFCPN